MVRSSSICAAPGDGLAVRLDAAVRHDLGALYGLGIAFDSRVKHPHEPVRDDPPIVVPNNRATAVLPESTRGRRVVQELEDRRG